MLIALPLKCRKLWLDTERTADGLDQILATVTAGLSCTGTLRLARVFCIPRWDRLKLPPNKPDRGVVVRGWSTVALASRRIRHGGHGSGRVKAGAAAGGGAQRQDDPTKAAVLEALHNGELTLEEASRRYALSVEEAPALR
jgi:hypothetical protein